VPRENKEVLWAWPRRRARQKRNPRTRAERRARPLTTPPAIGPARFFFFEGLLAETDVEVEGPEVGEEVECDGASLSDSEEVREAAFDVLLDFAGMDPAPEAEWDLAELEAELDPEPAGADTSLPFP
jgi:hypothetical protein